MPSRQQVLRGLERNAQRMCEILVGLPDVVVLGVLDGPVTEIHLECRRVPVGCPECGVIVQLKEQRIVPFVDLPCFGRPTRLCWHKRRFRCAEADCEKTTWTKEDARIAAPRMAMTARAGRWATMQVGRFARSVSEVADDLGCDWHTVNDAVLAYGEVLVDADPDRYGTVSALGLDEVLFARIGRFHRRDFSTQFVDVRTGQLLDVVPGRSGKEPKAWLEAKGKPWRDEIAYAALDLSGPCRAVLEEMLPDATLVADPFRVVKLANSKLDECRRRVQNETRGHRGRKSDPRYRCRRLLTMADERLEENGRTKLLGLLRAGDPRGEVTAAWVRASGPRSGGPRRTCSRQGGRRRPVRAARWCVRRAHAPPLSRARTLRRWRNEIAAWHASHVSNGPTEAVNNLIKRVKRAAFGFTSFRNYRVRSLLHAGCPNWALLATITPA
jgi:transposase